MANAREWAAEQDIANISVLAITNIVLAAIHAAGTRTFMYLLSHAASWYYQSPREWIVDLYIRMAVISHIKFFLDLETTKEWWRRFWALISRDRPPEGLPGQEIADVITKGLIIVIYIVFSYMFHRLDAVVIFLYGYGIWIVTLAAVLFAAFSLSSKMVGWWNGEPQAVPSPFPFLRMLARIGLALYNTPFLVVEILRTLRGRASKMFRSSFERWHIRRPMLLYDYKPLEKEKGEIRLIHLGRKWPGCEISCSLVAVPFDKAPPYEAISYTWGSSIQDHIVFFDGRWLPTTKNVHRILNDRASYSQARWIWIDAVCINQKDLEEKKTQVDMMGAIYRTAERVIVWLDDKELTHTQVTEATYLLEVINFNSVDPSANEHNYAKEIVGHRSHWQSLNSLLKHDYWTRAWIVQEVALAKEIHIVCSRKYIGWTHLVRMMLPLLIYPGNVVVATATREYDLADSHIVKGASRILFIAAIRGSFHDAETRQSLSDCLQKTYNCAATDPRDRIFSLMHLVKWPSDGAPEIQVDYKMAVADVFTNAARYLLLKDLRYVLMAAGIGHQRLTKSLPTWVPDFAGSTFLYMFEHTIDPDLRYRAGGVMKDNATGISLKHGGSGPSSATQLTAEIIIVSEVSHITSSIMVIDPLSGTAGPSIHAMADEMREFFREARNLAVQTLPFRYPGNKTQTTQEALWRTLIEDRQITDNELEETKYKRPASQELELCFLACLELYMSPPDAHAEDIHIARHPELRAMQTASSKFAATYRYTRLFGRTCRGRRFALMASGLMGLAPPRTKVGDVLCVMPGFEMPLLLRRCQNNQNEYEFVGVCYVHGIMDGEASSKTNGSSENAREVTIR
ncbi:heterokaryon incompatibility protein-domain-containing protein [Podospora didyma]|uniref:Heterokaryon incompatibility protein-domain-containing protein n=1 Tax=Podospora didyma TaxID=330526 RepID=A0AAE0N2C6_9PEZI|nr:heterokaryon incompatibility protein-domain-containing protein [Podospora didyma]